MRSLIAQICSRLDTTPTTLQELFVNCKNGSEEPSMEACIQVLQALLTVAPTVYIIIDALDECSERENQDGLFVLLARIHSWNILGLHMLVTSRQQIDIDEGLRTLRTGTLAIVDTLVNHDIKSYIDSRLNEGRLNQWHQKPGVIEHIKKTLEAGAGGM